MSINIIGHLQRRTFFSVLFVIWSCFWLAPACSSLLGLVSGCFTFYKGRRHKMTCEFTINQFHVDFVTTWGSFEKCYYKTGQVVLQSRTDTLFTLDPPALNGVNFDLLAN